MTLQTTHIIITHYNNQQVYIINLYIKSVFILGKKGIQSII